MSRNRERETREPKIDDELYRSTSRIGGLGILIAEFGVDRPGFDQEILIEYEKQYNDLVLTLNQDEITREEFLTQTSGLFELLKIEAENLGFTEEDLSDENLEKYNRAAVLGQIHFTAGMKSDRSDDEE